MSFIPEYPPNELARLPEWTFRELSRLSGYLDTDMASTDFLIEVARGNTNFSKVNKFGRNDTVGTTIEDIWDGGGTISYLSSAETMEIASTDANDTSAGTGARTVRIYGVDNDYVKVMEDVTLNGTTNVTTTNSYLRVYRMKVLTAGSGGQNAGNITATATTATTVQAQITAMYNQTLMAAYTMAANETGFLLDYYFSINKKTAASADVQLYIRPYGGVFQLKHILGAVNTGSGVHQQYFNIPIVVDEKSDIIMRAAASTSGVDISAGFNLIEG